MNTHADQLQKNNNQSIANNLTQKQGRGESTYQFVDQRPETVAQRKLQEMANNSPKTTPLAQLQTMLYNHSSQQHQPIQKKENKNSLSTDATVQRKPLIPANGKSSSIVQKYSYNADPAEITANLPKGVTQKWTESTGAKVAWNMGETMDPNKQGTHDVNNHGWAGLLKNQSNGNNATGLHIVNANWGGSANALDGNLVPGTPSLNGHHKSIENEVHKLFKNNGGTAPNKISYEADVYTPYDQTMDLTKKNSGEEINFNDPKIRCTVTVGTNKVLDKQDVVLGGGTKIVIP